MHFLVFLFSILLVVAGVIILAKPAAVFGFLEKFSKAPMLHLFAVVTRVVLGVALIVVAPNSMFPLTLAVIGWISLAAGVFVAGMGRNRFIQLIEWATRVLPKNAIVIGVIAILLGSFLAYAVR